MYEVSLTESLFPAQSSAPVWQTTVGAKLREVPARTPDAAALVEVTVDNVTGRRWNYAELLADSEELALALASRFAPGEKVAVWAHNIPEWVLMEYACGLAGLVLAMANPSAANRLVETEGVNGLVAVPTMILGMVEAFKQEPRDFSSVTVLSSGGSMVPPELVRAATATFGCDFAILYGQTEYSPVMTQHFLTDAFDDIYNTIGQPIDHTDISIQRVADNSILPIGEVGEICARGPCTMIGYHANPVATAETINSKGWLHTGDLGTMDARGYVRITGRVKEMIIRGGENFFPAEIENALLEHPEVAEIAVVGLPDEKWGEIIAAFCRTEGNVETEISVLRSHCREHLAPQKTPVVWERVTSFPLTGSGKIQKFALRDQYIASQKA